MKEFMQLEGLAYRLMPFKVPGAKDGFVNTDLMYDNMMNKTVWRELNNPKVYYNEFYDTPVVGSRIGFLRLAGQLITEGKKDKAKAVLNKCFEVMPDKSIPEIQLLTEQDWLGVAKDAKFETDTDLRITLRSVRMLAKDRFADMMQSALNKYTKANNGQLPDDLSQLQSYFQPLVEDAVLRRYKMLETGNVNNVPQNYLVEEINSVDENYDTRLLIGLDSIRHLFVGESIGNVRPLLPVPPVPR